MATFGEIAAHSVYHRFSSYFDYISYFPFWFLGLDLGSDLQETLFFASFLDLCILFTSNKY